MELSPEESQDPNEQIFVAKGTTEQIDKAKHLIQQLIAPLQTVHVPVPLSKVGLIIGKGGATIQQVNFRKASLTINPRCFSDLRRVRSPRGAVS